MVDYGSQASMRNCFHVPSTVDNMKSGMWPPICGNVDMKWLVLIPWNLSGI